MNINKYQFQSEVFNLVKSGQSEEYIRKDVMRRQGDLRHLAGENPSLNEFKKVLLTGVSTIIKDRALAKKQGPLAAAQLELWGLEVALAGDVVAALSAKSPKCMKDLQDVKAALDPINTKPDERTLAEGILLLDGQYQDRFDSIYGVTEEDTPDEG